MQAPEEKTVSNVSQTPIKCPGCHNIFPIAKFVEHLVAKREDANQDFAENDGRLDTPFWVTEPSKCYNVLAEDSKPFVCNGCGFQGPLQRILHDTIGACPPRSVLEIGEFPPTVPKFHAGSAPELLLPDPLVIGRYTIVCRLGEGANATVFSALSSEGEPVALKVPKAAASPVNELRVLRALLTFKIPHVAELVSLERLDHASTCNVTLVTTSIASTAANASNASPDSTPKADSANNRYVLAVALRLAYGGDLNAPSFPKAALYEKLLDLASTLVALWDHRICHFDIKPANIFWQLTSTKSVEVFLGDFGCAKQFRPDEQMEIDGCLTIGTLHFNPREMHRRDGKTVDGRAFDAFSLGATLQLLDSDDDKVIESQEKLLSDDPEVRMDEVVRLAWLKPKH
eukprot:GILI01005027.1.p1 GENE.GILI01005027.1~~GILI01005027.1.p1  ORF type:complete len:413 (+),score=63.17 GILI01005027.1:40-1239(+)